MSIFWSSIYFYQHTIIKIRLLKNTCNVKYIFLLLSQGCGRYAGGQGYNSIGHFCGGWAGNCGDGGIGGSTWYLVCDRCREKYLREKQTAAREKVFLCHSCL